MPVSGYPRVVRVMDVLRHVTDVASILDVGIGFGKYGCLFREHLDVRRARYAKESWEVKIDGIEVWPQYITDLHRYVYDQILIGDIRELEPTLGVYDLIVLADVIEHMPKAQGEALVHRLFSAHCSKAMVVSFPNHLGRGWDMWENPHERHHCVWSHADFVHIFGPDHVVSNKGTVVYLLRRK